MPRSHSERHLMARVGWLRAAVLGANDGLLSTASLIVGVAAAEASKGAVLVSGVAGLVAGAMSMAAGEYVSVSSQSDTEKADLAREAAERSNSPNRPWRDRVPDPSPAPADSAPQPASARPRRRSPPRSVVRPDEPASPPPGGRRPSRRDSPWPVAATARGRSTGRSRRCPASPFRPRSRLNLLDPKRGEHHCAPRSAGASQPDHRNTHATVRASRSPCERVSLGSCHCSRSPPEGGRQRPRSAGRGRHGRRRRPDP